MPSVMHDVRAHHVDGREIGYQEFIAQFPAGAEGLRDALVNLDDGGSIGVEVQPENGERIRAYTQRIGTQGVNSTLDTDGNIVHEVVQSPPTAVIEIQFADGRFVRLYLGPRGALLSTVDRAPELPAPVMEPANGC
jgi:hypothetical protein